MDVGIAAVLYLIMPAVLLGWAFRRAGLFEVAGFVLGGVLSYHLLGLAGLPAEDVVGYTEPLQLIGLVLFSFEVGASLNVRNIARSVQAVLSAELVLLAIAWIASGFAAHLVGLDGFGRLVLFLVMVNSPTFAIVAMQRVGFAGEAYERAVLQTSLEDVLQFSLFGLLIMAPALAAPAPVHALVHMLQLAGSVLALFLAARLAVLVVSRSPLVRGRLDKFFVLVALALLFSALASILNLPELLGSFVAGLAASLYLDLGDVREMMSGVRDLGLLLYFTSVGAVISPWVVHGDAGLLMAAAVVALVAILTRAAGLLLGFAFSGAGLRDSISLSLVLSPISEAGVVFAHALYRMGLVSRQLVALVTVAVVAAMLLSSPVVYKSQALASRVESSLPRSFTSAVSTISRVYQRRVDFSIQVLSTLAWFSAMSIVVTTATNLAAEALAGAGAPAHFLSAVVVASLALLLVVYALSLRRLMHAVVEALRKARRPRPLLVLDSALDSLMGFLAIILQAYLLYEYAHRYWPLVLAVEHLAVYAAALTIMALTVYSTVRHYRRLAGQRERGAGG